MIDFRIGNGYDVHRFSEERDLFLGCVKIPHEKGLLGHSDADVLCHAICDAMLGACALGDIGKHFPDRDPKYLGAKGSYLLAETARICRESGYELSNLDSILILQRPKVAPFIDEMVRSIASAVGVSIQQISIKATTEEKLGFTGREEGVSAHAVCIMKKI